MWPRLHWYSRCLYLSFTSRVLQPEFASLVSITTISKSLNTPENPVKSILEEYGTAVNLLGTLLLSLSSFPSAPNHPAG